ncbi:Uncaracterized surface protein containing fasciclin (FAS1) repeats [Streptomyces zhaozhouensis]|uniref:Uncaracterized surface protein containing fasciclin (FAS1) repeats n=1 Tax=Streptomyces zhaozhouensis TaxID=1300267 RepID=A0A286DZC1_9ACTN|nr:fasciclin domain-containing protein [Streptomyces zhaozhouensis]SOD64001.1 Uncaracterized surface protein containing fasciclin (FAS1) repeats [Streptomyces zhaozhouensis]
MRITRVNRVRRTAVALVAVAALPMGLAACSSDDDSDQNESSEESAPEEESEGGAEDGVDDGTDEDGGMEDGSGDMAAEPFGPACSAVPEDGAGSFDGMAQDPVATAAGNNPELSTLVSAVEAAGLGDTLNTTEDLTVFAPVNDAFAGIAQEDLDALLADEAALTDVLTYHVVPQRLAPEDLTEGDVETLQGGTVAVSDEGESWQVNDASVVCGNVQTANATVYLIDGVLMPQ